MACGCSAKSNNTPVLTVSTTLNHHDNECTYTVEMINSWRDLLECVNKNGKLSLFGIQKSLYNGFLGVLISVQNAPDTICYFKKELDILNPYIVNIINSEEC